MYLYNIIKTNQKKNTNFWNSLDNFVQLVVFNLLKLDI